MKIITLYAVVCNGEIISSSKIEKHAIEQCEILNTVNKTDGYTVVACNGILIVA